MSSESDRSSTPPRARLRAAAAEARGLARRASVAVTTAAADNAMVTVLAVGAATAALSWLAAQRRRADR
jgi:hypothetical protein